ncbi:MAG: biotin--[acetyl-CoA-carboxylase] ligase [Bacteroidales bacterium]|nr:biotin--[acetyl-CoA-carboxylase] ligase [Bacteroidales bacterium]
MIVWYDSIDSTNSEALRRLPELPSGTVLAAREQTSGRGQRGNTWFTEAGKNLTFSIVLKPSSLAAGEAHLLNYLASVAVAEFLEGYGVSCSIKWPNDIYVGRKKICGILVENSLSGGCVAASVIGIGININQTDFPQLANATSLSLATGCEYVLEDCLKAFMTVFEAWLPRLKDLPESYTSLLFQKGVQARYIDYLRDGEEFTGTIQGVSPDGRLIIKTDAHEERLYRFKEVGYIL